jgi:hypothetical protein
MVIQVTAAGDAFDAAEHAGIEAQRDGGGFTHITPMQGGLHEALIELAGFPKQDLRLLGLEFGEFSPGADGGQVSGKSGHGDESDVLGFFALKELVLRSGHEAGKNDAVTFSIRPEDAEDGVALKGFAEVVIPRLTAGALLVRHQFEREGVFEGLLDVLRWKGGEVEGAADPVEIHVWCPVRLFFVFNEFYLIALGGVNESEDTAGGWRGAV